VYLVNVHAKEFDIHSTINYQAAYFVSIGMPLPHQGWTQYLGQALNVQE